MLLKALLIEPKQHLNHVNNILITTLIQYSSTLNGNNKNCVNI